MAGSASGALALWLSDPHEDNEDMPMTATLLATRRVEKPWGRHDLWPGFANPAADADPVGEVWFQPPGDGTPDLPIT